MVCVDFKILEINVPVIFSGTRGFPARRDGHYRICDGEQPHQAFIQKKFSASLKIFSNQNTAYWLQAWPSTYELPK